MLCLFELALIVWGTFPCSNGHFLDFGAIITLAGMVWDTYIVISQKLQIRIGLFTTSCKKGPEKSAPECPFNRRMAVKSYLGLPYFALYRRGTFYEGASH